uniref:AlNc14C326G10646 protein n=1 Tax=Albugo laibachii Nc14 TaxID=890382 RepID=F0WGE5_9STRA|nr:AlNc14C91G5677 [Albugo laibachii Nc14]CCA25858.1 AlNc14C326G10646 [Albugo laibachii Nc14]|eukprot:CCA25858.1 AlNc14C326G10646 [Albugo laibachii Nc14]
MSPHISLQPSCYNFESPTKMAQRVAALTKTSQNLKSNTRSDGHSRVHHLMQEFLGMLDELSMEGSDGQEPGLWIKLLPKLLPRTLELQHH